MPKYDNYESGTAHTGVAAYGALRFVAQTFTPGINFTISSVKLGLCRSGLPGTINVSIQGTTGTPALPDGSDLCSGTINGDTLETSAAYGWGIEDMTEITFSIPRALTAGTTYAIVIKALSGDGGNCPAWHMDTVTPVYTSGTIYDTINGGTSWTDQNKDGMFQCWGVGASSTPSNLIYDKKLVAVGNYEVWYQSAIDTMSELSAAHNVLDVNNRKFSMFEAYGKVFFVNEDLKYVADFVNIKLTTDDIKPAGKEIPHHGNLLSCGDKEIIVDYITSIDGVCTIYGRRVSVAQFTNGNILTGINNDGDDVYFTLNADEIAGPHWYEWTVYANDTSTYGELPAKPTLGCLFLGRATLAGDLQDPNQWYMSRQENMWDWNYGATDAQAPVSGEDKDAGKCGDIITALIPHKRDYLFFGCANSCWLMEGNPMENGVLDIFDNTTGVYGHKSWCFDNDGNLYFWGKNGVYKAAIPGFPTCISQGPLPKIVADESIDPSIYHIVFGFDSEHNGIVVAITKLSDGNNSNYWYDLTTEGFFPESYPDECGIFSMFSYGAIDPDYRKLVLGCNNGYLSFFDDTAKNDDKGSTEQAIDSYISWGPLLMAKDPSRTGKITRLILITAGGVSGGSQSDSDNVECKIFLGKSAAEVIEKIVANANPSFYKVIQAPGRQRGGTVKCKLREVYAGIRIGNNTSGETWALEQLLVDAKQSGRLK